jgi:hypothetical protein
MSWEFWAIVTGLTIMAGILGFCMALLYSGARIVHQAAPRQEDAPGGSAKDPFPRAA